MMMNQAPITEGQTTGYAVCETVSAISTHARQLSVKEPAKFSGHSGQVAAFCGVLIGWDTRLPFPGAVRCAGCREAVRRLEHA